MGQKATALNEFLGAEYCRGDFCGRPIRINRRPSPLTPVGARAVGSGREGLYGRPRPVHLASILGNTTTSHPLPDTFGTRATTRVPTYIHTTPALTAKEPEEALHP